MLRIRSERWRWYRFHLGRAALVAAIGGSVFVVALTRALQLPWYEHVGPSVGTVGLKRVETSRPVVSDLLSSVRNDQVDVHLSRLTAADGTALVGEELIRYSRAHEAERALRAVLARDPAPDKVRSDGLYNVSVDCPARCWPARIARNGRVLILLVGMAVPSSSDAPRTERALADVSRRYGEILPAEPRDLMSFTQVAIVAAVLLLAFAPFGVWQAWVALRARRTPHRHEPGAPATPPGVIDVCDAAAAARRRGHWRLATRLATFVLAGTLIATRDWLMFFALGVVPLWWYLERHLTRRRGRASGSAYEQPVVVVTQSRRWSRRYVRASLEVAALQAVAGCVTVAAWAVAFVGLLGVSIFIRVAVLEPDLFVPHSLEEITTFGVGYGMAAFVVFGFLIGASAVSRLARRLHVIAADRAQESRPRPLLLYLRAFEDDYRLLAASGGSGTRAANELFSFRARVPFEEVVARELGRHGVVVAVAEPATPRFFLPLGASRRRFSDQEWRAAIRARMREAALVVIAVGSTEGLLWELGSAAGQGHLQRTLLIVPPGDDEEIRARWNASAAAISAIGGPVVEPAVDPATILVAQLGYPGLLRAVIADRRDEHAYAAAIGQALVARGGV